MIALSKLDGSTMFVNEDLIERIEGDATTVVYLTNSTYLVVRDDVDAINERIRAEKVTILARAVSGSRPANEGPNLTAVAGSTSGRDRRT